MTSWTASGGKILRNGAEFCLRGLNWSGFETTHHGLLGIDQRPLDELLMAIREYGFTALRLPVSSHTLRDVEVAFWLRDKGLPNTSLAMLKAVLDECAARDLVVLLDFHTWTGDATLTGAPYDRTGTEYAEEDWLVDLEQLAKLSISHPAVFGVDLCNEPYRLTSGEWIALVNRAARRVLQVNPRILIFVGGLWESCPPHAANWGETFLFANADDPFDATALPVGKLVYTPHTYGPGHSGKHHYTEIDVNNASQDWDHLFGHLARRGRTVVLGEFQHFVGDPRRDALDLQYLENLMSYMVRLNFGGWFYWALNCDVKGDGLFQNWTTPKPDVMEILNRWP